MENVIQDFMIDEMLITPIQKIIIDIENNKMRDCDVEWCNKQAKKYTGIALKTLNLRINIPNIKADNFNEYAKEKFLTVFNFLLKYFKENYA